MDTNIYVICFVACTNDVLFRVESIRYYILGMSAKAFRRSSSFWIFFLIEDHLHRFGKGR